MLRLRTSTPRTGGSRLLPVAIRVLLGIAAVAAGSAPARAQEAPPKQEHVKVGAAELAPKVIIGGEYDTNAYREEKDENAVFSIAVHPSAVLSYRGESAVLDLSGAYHFQKYLDFKPLDGVDYSNLDRYRDGNAGLKLQVLPRGLAGVNLEGRFASTSRQSEAWYSPESALIQRFSTFGGGRLAVRPGEALDFQGGGYVSWDDYNVPETANVELSANYNSRFAYGATLAGRWRFFPRTAVVIESSWEWFDWTKNLVNIQTELGVDPSEKGSYLGIPDGEILRVEGGMRGRVTERLHVNALAGYAWGTYDGQTVIDAAERIILDLDESVDDNRSQGFGKDVEGVDGLLVTLIGEYATDQTSKISVGYLRDVQDVYFTNYLVYDYLYGKYHRLLTPRLGAAVEGGYRLESFRGEVSRDDHVLRARGDVTYAFNRWLSTSVGAWWDERASVGGENPSIEFDNVNVHLQLIAQY